MQKPIKQLSKNPPIAHKVNLTKKAKTPKIDSKKTVKLIVNILNELNYRAPQEIGVVFCKDPESHKLNLAYRKKDKPTDVLSFSATEGQAMAGIEGILGDLVISVDTAKRQAKEYGVTFNQEILRLIIHGILHLSGYDHENVPKAEAQRMRRLEERLYLKFSKMI